MGASLISVAGPWRILKAQSGPFPSFPRPLSIQPQLRLDYCDSCFCEGFTASLAHKIRKALHRIGSDPGQPAASNR